MILAGAAVKLSLHVQTSPDSKTAEWPREKQLIIVDDLWQKL